MEELDLKLLKEYTIYDIVRIQDVQTKLTMRAKYYQYLRVFVLPICQELNQQGIRVSFSKPYGLTIQQMLKELKQICIQHQLNWEEMKGEKQR